MAESPSTGRSLLIVIVAFVVVSLAIAGYAWYGRQAPASAGEVLSLNLYPIHRDLSTPGSVNGLGGQADLFDEMLLFADVRIENKAAKPLVIDDMWSTVDLGDSEQRNTAVSQADFDKVFVAYPDARKFRKPAMPRDLILQPGEQHEGLMVFHYEIPKAQWDARKSMDIHVSFKNQNDLDITVPTSTSAAH